MTVPLYFLSAREDYIAPWKTTYLGARLVRGPVRFVLAGSGHIAGVINPAGSKKYGYATPAGAPSRRRPTPGSPARSSTRDRGGATGSPGCNPPRASRCPRARRAPAALPALGDAPGSYVKVRHGVKGASPP